MNDFFNSLGNTLYDGICILDHSIHKTDLKDSFVDNFIHELKDYLFKSDTIYRLSKLPKGTFLDINEIEENCIQCYFDHAEYCVPKDMICSHDLEGLENDGWIKLQLQDDNLYHIIRFDKITHKPIQ